MGSRGRKSKASLTVISNEGIEAHSRPPVPPDLTEEQGVEWVKVVNSLPADWFQQETLGMLTQYCRHVVSARRVSELIIAFEKQEEFDLVEFDRLLKMQEREGRAISSLATRMRMSQQTSYDKSKKKPKSLQNSPWEK